jgi:Flp pilus assembly protein TadG
MRIAHALKLVSLKAVSLKSVSLKSAFRQTLRSAIYGRSRGSALIEFALSITILITTVIGVTEVTQFVRADMKLRHTTEAYAKMVSQQTAATPATMADLCTGAAAMMAPFDPNGFSGSVTSMSNVGGSMNTDWTQSGCAGGSAAAANTGMAQPMMPNPGDSMLVANGSYQYLPMFHLIIPTTITLTHTVIIRPRSQTTIPNS